MKTLQLIAVLFFGICNFSKAQDKEVTPLFQNNDPLEVRLSYSFKSLRKDTNDTLYMPTFLAYKDENGVWDSVPIDLRTRGNFRKNHCYYPPLRINIKKKNNKGTLFEGNQKLKLVLPCQTVKTANDLILKEFLCYKLYETIIPVAFHTRLIDLTLINDDGKNPKIHTLKAFLIEDDDLVAKRFDGKIISGMQINPLSLKDTLSTKHDFFQLMIANTDWSTFGQHNVKIMYVAPSTYIPLAYDFDMSGVVNPPYAQVSDLLPIGTVRDRLYRGFCRDEALFEYVRSEYLRLEPQLMGTVESIEDQISGNDIQSTQKFLRDFFDILKNDRRFENEIIQKCRN